MVVVWSHEKGGDDEDKKGSEITRMSTQLKSTD